MTPYGTQEGTLNPLQRKRKTVYPRRIRDGRRCIASNAIGRLHLVTYVEYRAKRGLYAIKSIIRLGATSGKFRAFIIA